MEEEFNERFETVEQALKYIADSQARSEFISKQASIKHDKDIAEMRELQKQIQENLNQTQKHLNHITKVLRFVVEEHEFQEGKIEQAGEILSRKRKK